MINTINEKPTLELHGRPLFASLFITNPHIKNKTILDIGCGYGWMELNLLKRGAKKIVGLEISKADLSTAKKNIENKKIKFVVGSAITLPFKISSFNTVISWEFIEHIPLNTEDQMFKEVRRVLKKNGVFYLSTPYDAFLSKFFDPAWWLIGHRHYSTNKLVKLADSNGFMVESFEIRGGWWEILGMLNLYISKWIFKSKPFFESGIEIKKDSEYSNENGFANIFFKFKKI